MTGDELLTVSLPPNCDMIWLKFLLDVTLFFVTDTWIRPGDAANGDAVVDDDDDDDVVVVVCCFCSKIEIRSEIGVFPDWVSRVAILILLFDASDLFSIWNEKLIFEKQFIELSPPALKSNSDVNRQNGWLDRFVGKRG